MRPSYKTLSIALAGLIGLTSAPVGAQTPSGLRDLVGARAGQAEGDLQGRGYESVRTQEGGTTKWTYWRRGDECVQISTRDGRYESINRADRSQCAPSSGGGSGAGAAVAAVAIVGLAAALAAHKKNHGDADQRHDDEYQRGYQAALYGAPYDDRHDSEGYHEGFRAGDAERGNRQYANSGWVRGAPQAAQDACSRRADDYQNQSYGSSVPVGVRDLGRGMYEMTVATGRYRSRCVVSAYGAVQSIDPY